MNKKNTRFLLSTGTTFLVVFYFLSGVISTQASGGGISGWATTTSQVAGENILYSNNSTDILCLGGTATTTCPFYFDPNTNTSKLSGTLSAVIIPLQGTAASLVSVVPASGQTVYETDTKYVKVGDGTTAVGALNPTNLWTASANGYSSLKHVGIGTNPASSNGVALNVSGGVNITSTTTIGDTSGGGNIASAPLFTVVPIIPTLVAAEIDDFTGNFGALFGSNNTTCKVSSSIPCTTAGIVGYNFDGVGSAVQAQSSAGNYAFYGVGGPSYLQKTLSIGTTTTHTSVSATMAAGDIYVASSTAATGIILQASDASCHRIVVSSTNVISASTVTCPN